MAKPDSCCKTSRSDLISLLSQACEFEHALACSYLFTSFTLKQEINEGITWRQQQLARRWAADLFAIAAEEMLHFAQVWNLLAAVGGNPYYWRPAFPVLSNYYPTDLPIELTPFNVPALERFVQYETPDEEERHKVCQEHGIQNIAQGVPPYNSVAQLYTVILEIFESFPEDELFIGKKERQVGEELADFPTLIKVVDRATAIQAVNLIKEQGEGAEIGSDQANSVEELDVDRDGHYGVFLRILREYQTEQQRTKEAGEPFEVVRDVIENRVSKERPDSGASIIKQPQDGDEIVGRLIQDPYTREVAQLFDRVYLLMLRLLQYVFRNSTDDANTLRAFSQTAIGLMPTLIKPLGESLMLLPAGKPWGSKTAGPAFGLSRHVTLPENPWTAMVVVQERLQELVARAAELAEVDRAPKQLVNARRNLEDWLRKLQAEQSPDKGLEALIM